MNKHKTEQDSNSVASPEKPAPQPKEVGGRQGPEPTRYGDWEKGGKCVDF